MKYYVPLALLLIVLAFKFCSTNFPVDHYLNETNRVLRGGFPIGAGWWLNFLSALVSRSRVLKQPLKKTSQIVVLFLT